MSNSSNRDSKDLDEKFLAWAAAQSENCKRLVISGRAAVMPLEVDVIKYGVNEPFRRADSEEILRVNRWLHERLDRPVPGITP